MIDATVAAEVPFAWFTADEEFGQNPGLRNHLQAAGISYVMAVPKNTTFIDPTGKQIKLQRPGTEAQPHHLATPRMRNRCKRLPGLRLGAAAIGRPQSPVHHPQIHRRR